MRLEQLIARSIMTLTKNKIDLPQLDTRLLIAHALNCDRAALMLQGERALNKTEIAAIEALIARRAAHEPIGRIMGHREFWGLSFGLNEATLEPRPDSETLIETALETMTARYHAAIEAGHDFTLLDLGTGTGCLLLSLLSEWPRATGLGIDKSPRAVEQALQNAAQHKLIDRATFMQSDWLTNVSGKFDVIISNPPYIKSSDIPLLDRDVQEYDPLLALDGGDDGLDPYKLLIPQLRSFLKKGGGLFFEVGQDQAQEVANLMAQSGFSIVSTAKDLGEIERCIYGLYS